MDATSEADNNSNGHITVFFQSVVKSLQAVYFFIPLRTFELFYLLSQLVSQLSENRDSNSIVILPCTFTNPPSKLYTNINESELCSRRKEIM